MLNLFFCGHFYLRLLRDSPGWGKDPLRGFNEHDLSSSSRVKSGNFLKLADRLTASQMFSTQETKRQLVAHGDDSSIANCRTKPSQYFLECMEFFAVFKYCYIFIPRFLAKLIKTFCEILVVTHCPKVQFYRHLCSIVRRSVCRALLRSVVYKYPTKCISMFMMCFNHTFLTKIFRPLLLSSSGRNYYKNIKAQCGCVRISSFCSIFLLALYLCILLIISPKDGRYRGHL